MSNPHRSSRSRRLLPPIAALTAFEAVARRESFTAAAVELALSQSAVSREIKSLEERLGVRLFNRTRQRVLLTPAGLLYVQRVRHLLDALTTATSEIIASRGGGTLRLGILPTFGTRWLIPRLPDFFKRHPTIEISFVTRSQGIFDFSRENLDATIHAGSSEWPGVRLIKFADQEMIVVAAPHVAASLRGGLALQDMTLLRYSYSEENEIWSEWCARATLEMCDRQRLITFETYQMVIQAAVTGLGVAIVPVIMVQRELLIGELVPVSGPLTKPDRGMYLVYPAPNENYMPVTTFRDWLLSFACIEGPR
jgi:DNA-binding transcriptional LysR family regulator